MLLTQCSVVVIEIADLCAWGEKFNWSWHLLNSMFEDVMLAQHKKGHKFYYSWLLILISFIVWADPPDYVHMDVPISFLGTRYQNLWEARVDSNHQQDNNIAFFMPTEVLRQVVWQTHRIRATTMHRYTTFVKFEADVPNINMLPTKYPLQ